MEDRVIEIPNASAFLTLPNEKILIAKRQHWIVLVPGLTLVFLFALGAVGVLYLVAQYFTLSRVDLIVSGLLIWSLGTSMVLKQVIDWYYHFYIVTTRKILEVFCSPMYWDRVDDVFLDQVRTTEVDIEVPNLLFELLHIGNVTISFDRPSHDKSFVLRDIYHPHTVGNFLGLALEAHMESSPVWFKKDKKNQLLHAEDTGAFA